MQTAIPVGAMMIAATSLIGTSAEAGRVRVSQVMTLGAQDFVAKGFVKTFDKSEMSAAEVYDYNGRCSLSYGGTAFLPELNATVMAVIDTVEGRALFMVHDISVQCFGPDSSGGTARMSFALDFDDSMACLVQDDPGEGACAGPRTTTAHTWLPDFTDGLVLGPLDGLWQLDASFSSTPVGISQVIVRSAGGGDITGLSTDRTIRFDNALEVGVDVQPGPELGCLNIDGNGLIPVAILGAADFDVSEIDTSTLNFAGMQIRVRGNGRPQCSIEDVNDDAHLDLACHFFDDPDAWLPGDATAAVSGELLDSTPIYGEDSICVRPPA